MLKGLFRSEKKYQYEVAICCIVRDEEYLPEWIDYHILIGVTQFYIYDNESTVPVSDILKAYIEKGLVTVETIEGRAKQMTAYGHCLKIYGPHCKWIAFIDADEFIVPHTSTGSLPDFLAAYESYGGLGVNWVVFGSNGHVEKPQRPQIESYTTRLPKSDPVNDHVKTIVQPRFVKAIPSGPHNFHYVFGKYSVNENFKRFKGAFSPHSSNKIQLNHYWLRSEADYKEKLIRGRGDQTAPEMARKMADFYETDKKSTETDDTILVLKALLDKTNKK
ncbi:MAG TPA: glycosyltransferase family 2 protein [Mucilaginibacter sp.]|nr:glycosyltransferase family 2 protein [Mucilaginibacter sp.]